MSPNAVEIEGAVDFDFGHGNVGHQDHAQQVRSNRVQRDVARAIDSRRQTKKDTKSIGQNLYDSFSMIYSYSKLIPSSLLALDTLQISSDSTQQGKYLGSANDSTVTVQMSEAASMSRRQSQQDSCAHSQSHATREPLEVLGNGQQIHRVPYHRPTVAGQAHDTMNTHNVSIDGTADTPRMSISKSGRKSFTLGGSIMPPTAKTKATPTAVSPNHNGSKPKERDPVAIPIVSSLNCDMLDQWKDEVYCVRQRQCSVTNLTDDYDAFRRVRLTKAFVNRSLFYTLSDAKTLLQSFHDSSEAFQHSPLPHLDSARLVHSFRDWSHHNGGLLFDSLSVAIEALFTPPPMLDAHRTTIDELTPSGDATEEPSNRQRLAANHRYFSNYEAAHIVMICIHVLTSSVPVGWPHSWAQLRSLRSWGVVVPSATGNTDDFVDPYMTIIDALEYEPAVRLVDRLLQAIGARTCFDHILMAMHKDATPAKPGSAVLEDSLMTILVQHLEVIERVASDSKQKMKSSNTPNKEPGWTVTATLIEWLKTVIIKKWDGRVEVDKWSNVGTSIMLLHKLRKHTFPPRLKREWVLITTDDRQHQLNVWSRMFRIPYLNEHMSKVTDPVKFLDWKPQPNMLHILQYPELHPIDYLVRFFRTINLTNMVIQYEHSQHIQQMLRTLDVILRKPYLDMIKHHLRVTLNDYFVLDVSRKDPLKDTLDQLWKQEKKTLLKPLKVKLGQQEGEVGLDHGGVTYEFFRVLLGEAFAPHYGKQIDASHEDPLTSLGMFTIDPQTRMTWFQPGSLEPLWKFKMLGVLFSLAVYNGITLPVTFPLALYDLMLNSRFRFLDDHTSVDYIRDGWPELAKSFDTLLQWKDDDVADVFLRDYSFSYEVFGQKIDIAMIGGKSDTSLPGETPLVTNENRNAFIRDYVTHLVLHSIHPQLKAFKKGFYTCLNPRSLELFTPKTLKKLVEGTQIISIAELRACATYEDYDATHATVRMFWDIVQDYSQEDATHLLEFVTASDRVPITGYKSLTFNIVRMGHDSEQLPTSSTCFGKLYLPEYQNKAKMKQKLELAIQNAKGFGVV